MAMNHCHHLRYPRLASLRSVARTLHRTQARAIATALSLRLHPALRSEALLIRSCFAVSLGKERLALKVTRLIYSASAEANAGDGTPAKSCSCEKHLKALK